MTTTKKITNKKVIRQGVLLTTKIICIFLAGFIVLQFLFGFCYFRGNNMFPAVRDGDLLISFKLDPIVKEDLVLYKFTDNQGKTETKVGRMVATEGDKIDITDNGEILINGCVPYEEVFYLTDLPESSKISYPYTVSQGEVFILNDYRSGTTDSYNDSRSFGSIKKSDLEGKVWLLLRRRGF